jgi:hypothetical protein
MNLPISIRIAAIWALQAALSMGLASGLQTIDKWEPSLWVILYGLMCIFAAIISMIYWGVDILFTAIERRLKCFLYSSQESP